MCKSWGGGHDIYRGLPLHNREGKGGIGKVQCERVLGGNRAFLCALDWPSLEVTLPRLHSELKACPSNLMRAFLNVKNGQRSGGVMQG